MRTSVSNTSGQQQIGATHFRLFSRSVSQAYLSHSTTAECSTPSAENPIARPPAPAKSSMDLSGIVTDLARLEQFRLAWTGSRVAQRRRPIRAGLTQSARLVVGGVHLEPCEPLLAKEVDRGV